MTTKWSILCVFMVLGLSAFNANATNKSIYVWKDENGVLVFSDSPRKGAEKVKLNSPAMSMPSTNTQILEQDNSADQGVNFSVAITTPNQEETIRDNTGSVHVTGQVSPRFMQGHRVQLMLDGKPYDKPQSSTVFVMRNVDRGAHQVRLRLVDGNGKQLATSEPVTFYLHRRSVITGP
ncbi:DUF4124 domain-containing protein [Pseudoalteromonas sp. CnMc7-15]|uniref:DUF4124 domain-containing protein n=1 Tax=unclassified Pseudoalteromonas TaxID=194690 RepID=UPI001EF54CBB|nr:DUF4124 domain-containing protein [Pseudoalteromonas sp. CnMc7-15]